MQVPQYWKRDSRLVLNQFLCEVTVRGALWGIVHIDVPSLPRSLNLVGFSALAPGHPPAAL